MTGLESWLFGYAGKKLGDAVLEKFRGDKLTTELRTAVDTWSDRLPSDIRLASIDSLFPQSIADSELTDRPALVDLRNSLKHAHVPTIDQWEGALVEQWSEVGSAVANAHPFFLQDFQSAQAHMRALSTDLAGVCARNDKLFKTTVIDLLREALTRLNAEHSAPAVVVNVVETLADDHRALLLRIAQFDGRFGIWAPKGELECLMVPGRLCNMQWGWERTVQEQEATGKSRGDRENRMHWIHTGHDLRDLGLVAPLLTDPAVFELTPTGWRVAHQTRTMVEARSLTVAFPVHEQHQSGSPPE